MKPLIHPAEKQECFLIEGGKPLRGEVRISGNKNAVLPIIAAALLTDEIVILQNVPRIRDVAAMLNILTHLGVDHDWTGDTLKIQATRIRTAKISPELCAEIRTSFLFVAPLLARLGHAQVAPPGGDAIGRRRLDAHFYGLRTLGATADAETFQFQAKKRLCGRELFFDEASVTATEHILMAAVLAEGETVIRNAASEPHVQDLAQMLTGMGAKIDGIKTNTLRIQGVDRLHGVQHRITPEHVEAASFLAFAAATGGSITVQQTVRGHFWMINRVFERFGIQLELGPDFIHLPEGQIPRIRQDLDGATPRIDDGPWPQFPSDLMSTMMVLATQSEGSVLFFEKMYESRMYFIDRLIRMGANAIVCDPHRVLISGKTRLQARTLSGPDIRAGIALIGAALCAQGTSKIHNAWIIDRGYENLTRKLSDLNARIQRR